MNKRAAIELSINFLVILIISLTVFTFGVKFVYDLYNNSNELVGLSSESLSNAIEEISCGDAQLVCLSRNTVYLNPRENQYFTVAVMNNLGVSQRFKLSLKPKLYLTLDNQEQSMPNPLNIAYQPGNISETIQNGEVSRIPFGFRLLSGAKKGVYRFDVNVSYNGRPYTSIQKVDVIVK